MDTVFDPRGGTGITRVQRGSVIVWIPFDPEATALALHAEAARSQWALCPAPERAETVLAERLLRRLRSPR